MIDAKFLKGSALYGLSLLCVQGTAYILQVISASQMTAADYSVVRLAESSAAVAALFLSFGVPSAVLVLSAGSRSEDQRTPLVVASSLIIFVLAAIGLVIANLAGLETSPLLSALALLISLRLFLSATTQARQFFTVLAGASVAASLTAIIGFVVLRALDFSAYWSWACARVALEVVLVAILAFVEVRKVSIRVAFVRLHSALSSISRLAAPVGASLILRALVEHGPILWLAHVSASAEISAQVGLLITLGTIALVPATVVQAVMIPRFANNPRSLQTTRIFPILLACAGVTVCILIAGVTVAAMVLPWGIAAPTVVGGAIAMVLAKMAASISGGFLLVLQNGRTILSLNLASLALGMTTALLLRNAISSGELNSSGIIWAIAGVEMVASLLYLLLVRRSIKAL